MWQALFELLKFQFYVVIDEYEEAVLLRRGKFSKILKPGWHWTIPLLDEVFKKPVVPHVIDLPNISVETNAGRVVAVSANLECGISDIKKATLEVWDLEESTTRMAWGILAQVVIENDNEMPAESIAQQAETEIAEKAEEWGLDIRKLYITDYAPHRVFRLIGDGYAHHED